MNLFSLWSLKFFKCRSILIWHLCTLFSRLSVLCSTNLIILSFIFNSFQYKSQTITISYFHKTSYVKLKLQFLRFVDLHRSYCLIKFTTDDNSLYVTDCTNLYRPVTFWNRFHSTPPRLPFVISGLPSQTQLRMPVTIDIRRLSLLSSPWPPLVGGPSCFLTPYTRGLETPYLPLSCSISLW